MEGKVIKACPECGKYITGRTDKKYCSELCRNASNNKQSREANKNLKMINGILKKNRDILKKLIELRIRKATRDLLLQQGFNFYYVTSFQPGNDRAYYYFCYEYGYYLLENNYYKVVKRRKNRDVG